MACELLDRHGEYDLQKKCPVAADPAFFARELALIQLELGRVLLAAESEGWMQEGGLEGVGGGDYSRSRTGLRAHCSGSWLFAENTASTSGE